MNILIIEDEQQLSEALAALLRQRRYSVDTAYDGVTGEDLALTGIYDVIILDVMLPQRGGLDVLRHLREQGCGTPVLLLTAKSEIDDIVLGLDSGADDYLTKPFVTGELLARIRAMTRRTGEFSGDVLDFGGTLLDTNTHTLTNSGNNVKLGNKEYQIMELLMRNSKQIIPKERFIEKIWGYDTDAEYNAVEVYVSFLRKKLAVIGSRIHIKAVRGVGYSLEDGT